MSDGTAQNPAVCEPGRQVGAGATRRIASLSPRATMPGCGGLAGHVRARADDVGEVPAPIALIAGLSARSIVSLNVSAVTGSFDGGEKRKPGRIVNVYVRPSADRR